jgi:hypothetical protein
MTHGSFVFSAMTPSLLSIKLLMTALFLLLVTVTRSEDSDIRREVEYEALRHLHHDAQRVRY